MSTSVGKGRCQLDQVAAPMEPDLMGALLPTLQAEHLREGLTDYLAIIRADRSHDARRR